MSKLPPTRKKIEEAKKKGKVVKSQLLTKALVATVLLGFAHKLFIPLSLIKNQILLECLWSQGVEDPTKFVEQYAVKCLGGLTVLLLVGAVVSIGVEAVQSGCFFRTNLLVPDLSRIDPLKGTKRLVSGIKGGWLVLLKASLLLSVFAVLIRNDLFKFAQIFTSGWFALPFDEYINRVRQLINAGLLTLISLGVVEYVVNRRKYNDELSMTQEEVRREHKEDDGDPHMKSHRRAYHHEISMGALINRVRRAKVIVVEKA